MASSAAVSKGPEQTRPPGKPHRRLPMRPGRASRVQRVAVAVTKDEKRKVERVAKEVYNQSPSEVLYFKSVDQLVRAHEFIYGTESPNR